MKNKSVHAETVHSLAEFNRLVEDIGYRLSTGDKPVRVPNEFWYRGVNNGSYTLIPSLYRYRGDPIENERLLFKLHGHSVPQGLGAKLESWERVIHMQHYNIPTRLLDWTANMWIAVFFALEAASVQPCIYILNPLSLNRKSGVDGLLHIPANSHFDFEEHFFANPILSPQKPLAIFPEPLNERLRAQDGRFTIQGRDFESLERQAPECLARINLHESSHGELRECLNRAGITDLKIFPDHVGIAQYIRSRAGLKPTPYDESIASLIRYRLQNRAERDMYALTHRDKNMEPSSKGIAFCNLDAAYLSREVEADVMAAWHRTGPPFLFVTGEAGVGKTNFTLHTLLCHDGFREKLFVFFSFKMYDSIIGRMDRRESFGELAGYLYDIMLSAHKPSEQERYVARQMISEGDVILTLDGLDELARLRGIEAVEEVARELETLFGESSKTRVIITCRDHILASLKGTGILGGAKYQRELRLNRFPTATLREALQGQLGEIPGNLVEMARIPLFYEMIRRTWDHRPELLEAQGSRTNLEEVWFKIILEKNDHPALELGKLGAIAGTMLQNRKDLLAADSMPDELRTLLKDLSGYPLAIFVKELQNTYSFSHQSLREFVLAWCVVKEIKAPAFDLLKRSSSFDYEGHEFYDRVRHLLDIKQDVIEHLGHLLDIRDSNEGHRNNLIRNLFEMVGELTPPEDDQAKVVAQAALPYLQQTTTDGGYISYKTRYNVVRCLERIHWSAPRAYIDHIKHFPWWKDPHHKPPQNEYYVYAYAIRGFHRPRQEATALPPIIYMLPRQSPMMEELEEMVSDRLMSVIENIKEPEIPEDGVFLGINCTLALIRWLPRRPDLNRIIRLLQWRHIDWRMKQNLFYALFLRYGEKIPEHFCDKRLFCDAGELADMASEEAKEVFRRLTSDGMTLRTAKTRFKTNK